MDNNQNNYQNNNYSYNNINSPYIRPKNDPLAIASMVCGILSAICCCTGYAGMIFGVVAIVLACVCKKKSGRFDAFTTAGLILGIFGFLISLTVLLTMLLVPEDFFDDVFKDFEDKFGDIGDSSTFF